MDKDMSKDMSMGISKGSAEGAVHKLFKLSDAQLCSGDSFRVPMNPNHHSLTHNCSNYFVVTQATNILKLLEGVV